MIRPSYVVDWAVERWKAEVANRSLQNVNRRALDGTWRQVIRHFGGDDRILCGPPHDDLLSAASVEPPGMRPDPSMPSEGYRDADASKEARNG